MPPAPEGMTSVALPKLTTLNDTVLSRNGFRLAKVQCFPSREKNLYSETYPLVPFLLFFGLLFVGFFFIGLERGAGRMKLATENLLGRSKADSLCA